MSKDAMDDICFEQILSRINQEHGSTENKLNILFGSRGFFSAYQAARLLYAFGIPSDKVRAIQIMEPRLCRMTCSEARDIIGALSIHNDKIQALQSVKRVLSDHQTEQGVADILSAFPFEHDKNRAMQIMYTVHSDVGKAVPAGGHQGYAALGALYTQSRPLVPHLYGSVADQQANRPGYGSIQLPVEAKPGLLPSMYTGHPSYAYPQGRDYATDRGYPGNLPEFTGVSEYPGGAPMLGRHHGTPAPTGFQGLHG